VAASQEYPTSRIRNVVLVGHGGSGKTTLADAMCYIAGSTPRRGSVTEGTALTDFTPEEREHGMSIDLALATAPWMETKLNLVDTPGYFDFHGEAAAGIRIADGALAVVDAVAGVEAGTEQLWRACTDRKLPRMVFVNMMDRENASFDETFDQLQELLSDRVIPVEIPIGSGDDFRGIVNLFSERAHFFDPGGDRGEYEEGEVPEEMREREAEYHQELIETVATTDDELLMEYLEGEEPSRERVLESMAAAMRRGEIFPVFCGSAERGSGVRAVMKKLVELVPSPDEAGPYPAESGEGESLELKGSDDEPAAALVFKTASEPHTGELSFFRLCAGAVRNGDTLLNPGRSGTERISHLSVANGGDRSEVEVLHAGDIGVVAKLKDTHTGDTLCDEARPLHLPGIPWPEPDVSTAVRPASPGEEDRLANGLARLREEDPTFRASYEPEVEQTIARGLGELHLTISIEKLRRKYGVEVETEPPRIAYRETITRTGEGQGRHKKQTGGRGQFGDCWVRLEPLPRGEGYEFLDSIRGGVIPSKYVPAVDEGIREAARKGILAGYPVVDLRAEVYDGSHHSVDSSEQAFKIAGSLAFRQVAPGCGPILLEPVMEVEVTTPEEYTGDVIGDLNGRRGRVLGVEARGHFQVIRAHVPEAELYRYSAALRSITHGTGAHSRELKGYERVPDDVAERIVEQARQEA